MTDPVIEPKMPNTATTYSAETAITAIDAPVRRRCTTSSRRLNTRSRLPAAAATRAGFTAGPPSGRSPADPSCRVITRSVAAAASALWVTITTNRPRPSSWATAASSARIDAPVAESRLPVGSSARISGGSIINARATATRCIWPPDSSAGRCSVRFPSPTRSSNRTASALALPNRTPSSSLATATFSHADSVGNRLKN
ncbi:hypothetical protein C1Y40_02974 [Mycobacterium talmoniae]|uniref:Uncharacterized protein n=1 Tax=Mycobacterium talmoniae TaxID=1858794 RepID=A0A2S8BJQ1_9MYCO|nr:hypothetical protein C1Y40_02974 [Mycobacterium talmoniae]